jgi:hypothetical protein
MTIQPESDWRDGMEGAFDLSEKTYRAASGLNQSVIKLGLAAPQHIRQAIKCPILQTKAMDIGQLVHLKLLTPHAYEGSFAVKPKTYPEKATYPDTSGAQKPWSGNSNWCKAWQEETERTGKMIVSERELEDINNMVEAFTYDPWGAEFLKRGHKEVSLFAKEPETGLTIKAKLDIVCPLSDALYIVDLKKVADGEPWEFARKCVDLNYHLQVGISSWLASTLGDGQPIRFVHGAIDAVRPHLVHWNELDATAARLGEVEFKRTIQAYAAAQKSGQWSRINPITFPDWRLEKAS